MDFKNFLPALLLISFAVHAADTTQTVQLSSVDSTITSDSTMQTTSVKPLSLLPDRLGPMETMLWSQHGFMRNHFDFPLTDDGRENEMHLRRTMLEAHEIAGFATLAAMITTCVVGQIVYNKYPENISPGLANLKQTLGWTTVAMYFGTASLSIFTPPPMVRHNEWSSISTHKLLATIHFTGIILTPILASQIKDGRRPDGTPIISREAETFHMISGYTTTAAFAAAMMVVVF